MQKRVILKLAVILFIAILLSLCCHTHLDHFPGDGQDDHCPLCQILFAGFTASPSFELILVAILIQIVVPFLSDILKARPQTHYDNRASPFLCLTDDFAA